MATQTLEFSAGTSLTISCKLFAIGSDVVVDTLTATEKTNDLNRYSVDFVDVPAGAYRLNGFVGGTGGFANEIYDLTLTTATFLPRSEAAVDLTTVATSGQVQNLNTSVSGILEDTNTTIPNLITQVINVSSTEAF